MRPLIKYLKLKANHQVPITNNCSLFQKNKGPIIAFDIKGIHPFDLAKLLSTKGICIRSGHHCTQPLLKKFNIKSLKRISIYYYNTKEEIDFFYKSILKVIKVLN